MISIILTIISILALIYLTLAIIEIIIDLTK